jgi:hypothetical protein
VIHDWRTFAEILESSRFRQSHENFPPPRRLRGSRISGRIPTRGDIARSCRGWPLDTGFSGDGITSLTAGLGAYGNAVATQSDGKLVACGQYHDGSTNHLLEARYLSPFQADARVGPTNTVSTGDDKYNVTGTGRMAVLQIPTGGSTRQAFIGIQNDGVTATKLQLLGAKGNSKFTIQNLRGNQDVTNAVVAGVYQTPSLPPGGIHRLKARIAPVTAQANRTRSFSVQVDSPANSSKDVAVNKAVSK